MKSFKKSTNRILLGVLIFVIIFCAFLFTSLIIAQAHNQSLISEWQSWFGVVKEVKPVVEETVKAIIKI